MTGPGRWLAVRLPNVSLSVTGSPAGAVTMKLTLQFPNGTVQFELRARPAAVAGWLNDGRPKLPLRSPRTEMSPGGGRGAEDHIAVADGHPDLAVADRGS